MEDFVNDYLEIEELEFINNFNPIRRPYTVRERSNYFVILDDLDFFKRFRLRKPTVLVLLQHCRRQLEPLLMKANTIDPMTKLLVTLRFYATGSIYLSIADFAGVSKSTAAKIVVQVTHIIDSLHEVYIKLPSTSAEMNIAMEGFYKIASFPRVVGALDCTHVRMQSPGGNQAENFRNRKGYFSLNVQCVCDATLKCCDVVARWPRASHDANIFDNSRLRTRFENGEMGNSLLLGDNGYPIRNYLITPLHEPHNAAENLFNESQIRTRNVIERTFGIWKRRFPILSIGMRCSVPLIQSIIIATAILHNIAREENKEDIPPEVDVPPELENESVCNPVNAHGHDRQVQRQLIDYFRNLLN